MSPRPLVLFVELFVEYLGTLFCIIMLVYWLSGYCMVFVKRTLGISDYSEFSLSSTF